ncbi:MAG: hypothetical protein ACREMN_03625, partial [Gemmatimonadales bacterium]
PVRYAPPRPASARRDARPKAPSRRGSDAIPLEPEHLAGLTPEQRDDLRLWAGRVNLLDRVTAFRGYTVLTLGATIAGMGGFVAGISEPIPPLVLAVIVPGYMWAKLWRRGSSLRRAGVKLRRALLLPLKWVLPAPPAPSQRQLEQLAPREVLDGPYGDAIRRAAHDRAAILHILAKLSKADRALLPDVGPTVDALVKRVAHLAELLHRFADDVDPELRRDLDQRIARLEAAPPSADGERRLAQTRRQRASLDEFAGRRATLLGQLESAGLALGSLRMDLIRVRSAGLQAALPGVSTATQEAQALSRDIGAALEAVAEVQAIR